MQFETMAELKRACREMPDPDATSADAAARRQSVLTKPPGSLGRLEELALWLAAWQGVERPTLDHVQVLVFAGSHGVTARGVSAFPAEVTGQMVANFAAGGAAINQLAGLAGARLAVVPLEIENLTVDFTEGEAMSPADFLCAVKTGYDAVDAESDLACLGEMGIGNTTAASALCAGFFGGDGAFWVGRGTGVDDSGLTRKAEVVDAALALHSARKGDCLAWFAAVGGRELAAILGAALACRHYRIPLLLDGFACTAATAPLALLQKGGLDHARSAHRSAEQAHDALLERLGLRPLLDFDMRLGEASGACLAVNLVRAAICCHNGMASFDEAGVSTS